MTGRPLRIAVVEDHPVVRAAIVDTLTVPDLDVLGAYRSAEALLDALPAMGTAPDLVLIDIALPGMSGIELVKELSERVPTAHLVMLTGSSDDENLLHAIRAGATGYLTKDLSPGAILRSIRAVPEGDLPMPRHLAARVVRHLAGRDWEDVRRGDALDADLTPRELQVLMLLEQARTDRQIADALGISPRTVGRHVGNILDKLGVHSRAEAARRYREGL